MEMKNLLIVGLVGLLVVAGLYVFLMPETKQPELISKNNYTCPIGGGCYAINDWRNMTQPDPQCDDPEYQKWANESCEGFAILT